MSTAVQEAPLEFRVIWAIEVEADTPKAEVQEARAIQLTPGTTATVFDVWVHVANKMCRMDLIEQPGRLALDEQFVVRPGL
jgi:hypothetical protein